MLRDRRRSTPDDAQNRLIVVLLGISLVASIAGYALVYALHRVELAGLLQLGVGIVGGLLGALRSSRREQAGEERPTE